MQSPPPLNDPAISEPVLSEAASSVPPVPARNPATHPLAAPPSPPPPQNHAPPAPAPRASLPPIGPPALPATQPAVANTPLSAAAVVQSAPAAQVTPGTQTSPGNLPSAATRQAPVITPAARPRPEVRTQETRAVASPALLASPASPSKPVQRAQPVQRAAVNPSVQPATTSPAPRPVASAIAMSPQSTANDSRWRTDDEGTKSDKSDEALVDLEPVRRQVPAWLVSLIIHVTLLLLLALWTTPIGQGISRVVLEFGEATEVSDVDLEVFSLETSNSQFETNDSDAEVPVEMNMDTLIEAIEIAEPVDIVPLELGSAVSDLTVKPMFSGRTGAMKSALLAMYGGNQDTIDAVERGLRWLARNQEKGGSWSMRGPFDDGSFSENRIAATAMALLAFQGDGNTHMDGPYKTVVEKGLRYLLKKQSRRDGFFAREAPGHEKAYAQAQATIAICELYGMTKDSTLRPAAQAAVDYAVNAQSGKGGWRYEPRQDADLSVTGWYVMALSSAKSAGLEVEQSTLAIISGYLESVSVYEGAGYVYQRGRPATPAMTAEGLLCRQYLGWDRNHEPMKLGINTLVVDWPINYSDMDVYYWYYATQAIHHFGGSDWTIWNGKMKVELPKHQIKTGRESGSWSPQADEWGQNAGRLFTTCLSIYCLEVYYRHLPLYKSTGN